MSNILKVTAPIAGYESSNQARTQANKVPDPAIKGPVTPDKVTKPDARSDSASQDQGVALKFRYDSNYQNFIKQVSTLPTMTEEFSKIFFERFATLAQSGLGDGFSEQIGRFYEMIGMGAEDIQGFLKQQGNMSIKFSGTFFDMLSEVMRETSSVELKAGILDFLRRYADMSEGRMMMSNANGLLSKLREYMMPGARGGLDALIADLDFGAQTGTDAMNNNAQLLREKLLPFLNKYISSTHDRGMLRDLAANLASVAARLENGSPARVQDAFAQLLKYQGMQSVFKNFDPDILLRVLKNTEYSKAVGAQKWADGLVDLIESGVSGEGGAETRAAFNNLMQSILLNESVYMPVLHFTLPLQVDGKLMFSEMWIDPDAQKAQGDASGKRAIHGLVKFDIQDVGFFDLFFIYSNDKIKLQLSCPQSMEEEIAQVRGDITRILAEHSIAIDELFVDSDSSVGSVPISAAFPKIFERRNSVNVSI